MFCVLTQQVKKRGRGTEVPNKAILAWCHWSWAVSRSMGDNMNRERRGH